jgi:hypothetical protein
MKIKSMLGAALVCFVLFSSCRKELEGKDLDFIGYWESDNAYIDINTDSHGSYEYYNGAVTKSAAGRVRVNGNKLKVGLVGFKIDQRPTEDANGEWHMTLDGDDYYRY